MCVCVCMYLCVCVCVHRSPQVYETATGDLTTSIFDRADSDFNESIFDFSDATVTYPVASLPDSSTYPGRPEAATVLFALLDKSVNEPAIFLRILTTLQQVGSSSPHHT